MTTHPARGRTLGPNRRKAARRDLTYVATLVGVDAVPLGRCSVLDISTTGVRLATDPETIVPEEFVLALTSTRTVQRACRLVWRNEDELGAEFQPVEIDDVTTRAKDTIRRRRIGPIEID
ncbi:PilZ domain-containing protein [Phreatobacter sp.]|uniref:PilZ domain-containing protein n=1 Tax=Phreatobacter sp. TaxID=1966341 RepID=UPI003F6FCCE9